MRMSPSCCNCVLPAGHNQAQVDSDTDSSDDSSDDSGGEAVDPERRARAAAKYEARTFKCLQVWNRSVFDAYIASFQGASASCTLHNT